MNEFMKVQCTFHKEFFSLSCNKQAVVFLINTVHFTEEPVAYCKEHSDIVWTNNPKNSIIRLKNGWEKVSKKNWLVWGVIGS
jgi:hypothetical protein